MKKLIAALVIFALGTSMVCVSAKADLTTVFCTTQSSSGLLFKNEADFETRLFSGETQSAYFIPEGNTLFFDIDNSIFFGNSKFQNVDVSITYRDSAGAYFYLSYDSLDNKSKIYNDYIEMYNSKTVKTVDIRLEDCNFANRLDDCDFTITVPETSYGLGVYIYSVEVSFPNTFSGVQISSSGDVAGNIFFDGIERRLKLEYTNKHSTLSDIEVTYQVSNCDDNTVYEETTKKLSVPANETVTDYYYITDTSKYGTYNLHVHAVSEKKNIDVSADIPFSICVNASESGLNEKLGIGGHFNWGRECENGIKIIKNAGIGNLREGYSWSSFETKKGNYLQPQKYSDYIENSYKNSLSTLIMVGFNNTLLFDEIEDFKVIPDTDEQREAFADYVYELLKINTGKVSCIEVWNEPNITGFNYNNVEPDVYVKLLKAVYERVKPDFPEIKIASPALAKSTLEEGRAWFEKFLNTDLDADGQYDTYKYFDVATFHHYSTKFDEVVTELQKLNNLMDKYGCEDKEVYYTEFGVHEIGGSYTSTGEGTITLRGDKIQAAMLVKYYLTLQSAGIADKFFIYDFSNDGFIENYSENNYGIVETVEYGVPYAAKDALLVISNLNNLISGAEECSYSKSGDVSVVTFNDSKRKRKISAFFNNTDSENIYEFVCDGEFVEFLDIYGNKVDIEVAGDVYQIPVNKYPVYAKVYYNTDIDLRVYRSNENDVKICANLYNSNVGDMVGVKIFDESGKLVYINQLTTDETLYLEFDFKIPSYKGNYYLYMGSKSFNDIYQLAIDAADISKASIKAYSDILEITDAEQFKNSSKVTVKSELADLSVKSFKTIVAFYNKNSLVDIKIINSSEMKKSENFYSFELSGGFSENIESVKIFMFSTFEDITPLSKNIILE